MKRNPGFHQGHPARQPFLASKLIRSPEYIGLGLFSGPDDFYQLIQKSITGINTVQVLRAALIAVQHEMKAKGLLFFLLSKCHILFFGS
jgi:hypothetical protein